MLTESQSISSDGVTVVVPAYNEELAIGWVLQQLLGVMDVIDIPYEVIVVDDGSQDRTAKVAEEFEGVKVLRHNCNRGYGAAIKTGIRHAKHNTICITDADGTYPNKRIPELLMRLKDGVDMVVAARIGKSVAIPMVRRPAKWIIRRLGMLVAGEPIPDINSGLRVFRRPEALRFSSMLPNGFSFTTTITLSFLTNGYLVDYVPTEYFPRVGYSKLKPFRDTLNFVQLIVRVALYFAPLKIFLPFGGALMLLAIGWGLFSWFVLGRLADLSTIVIAMTAIQVVAIGLLAELIDRRLPDRARK